MPKIAWRRFLSEKPYDKSYAKKKNPKDYDQMLNANRQMLFQIRKRARNCMLDLEKILTGLKNILPEYQKQYYLIFKGLDDSFITGVTGAIGKAWTEAYTYEEKLLSEGAVSGLASMLNFAHIDYDFKKLLKNRKYRIEMQQKLSKTGVTSKYGWILDPKEREKRKQDRIPKPIQDTD